MKKRREKKEWVDDGRVIADMSVDGIRSGLGLTGSAPGKKRQTPPSPLSPPTPPPVLLSPTEKKSVMRGVLRGYLTALVIIVALLLLLFAVVWLWLR